MPGAKFGLLDLKTIAQPGSLRTAHGLTCAFDARMSSPSLLWRDLTQKVQSRASDAIDALEEVDFHLSTPRTVRPVVWLRPFSSC